MGAKQRDLLMERGADLSPDRLYRYRLWRRFGDGPALCVIGLNPSTADEEQDDPTITRLLTRAQQMGRFGSLVMVNLFAFRAADPTVMQKAEDPIGPENDHYLRTEAMSAVSRGGMVLCAWGRAGRFKRRDRAVLELLRGVPLHVLRLTLGGAPEHPLYLPYDIQPREWTDDDRARARGGP
jgi:hypothetical protein